MNQPQNTGALSQFFGAEFEAVWNRFDHSFRSDLLARIQQLGSLYRIRQTREELSTTIGTKFYEALEHALHGSGAVDGFSAAMEITMPSSFDGVLDLIKLHRGAASPLHSFMLLMLYIRQYPFRAFFSGRDKPLPFNTVALRIDQSPGDPLPVGVRYGLMDVDLHRCPGLLLEKKDDEGEEAKKAEHPRNHWGWIDPSDPFGPGVPIWIWHF